MAISSTPSSNRFVLKLNKGTSSSGSILTQSQSLNGLKKTAWTTTDDAAAYAIGYAARLVLTYPIYRMERSSTVIVEDDE